MIGSEGSSNKEARTVEESCLIIPGGESTTMAKVAEYHNLFPALREFVKMGKPVWGTCAGLIFLANKATGQKTGGQELIGGLDCTVHRNFFGSQTDSSFESELPIPEIAATEGGPPSCRAVFIRAPAIIEVGPDVEVLAEIPVSSSETANSNPAMQNEENSCDNTESTKSEKKVVVAVKQGNLLATAFHPELTADNRWHSYFLNMVPEIEEGTSSIVSTSSADLNFTNRSIIDLPIFQQQKKKCSRGPN